VRAGLAWGQGLDGARDVRLGGLEGERPAAAAAGETFTQLYRQCIDTDSQVPPTPAIRAYVEALLERWIDMTVDVDDVSPWSDGPLIDNASDPIIYFANAAEYDRRSLGSRCSNGSRPRTCLLRSAVGLPAPNC
jgi:hypothetical protein